MATSGAAMTGIALTKPSGRSLGGASAPVAASVDLAANASFTELATSVVDGNNGVQALLLGGLTGATAVTPAHHPRLLSPLPSLTRLPGHDLPPLPAGLDSYGQPLPAGHIRNRLRRGATVHMTLLHAPGSAPGCMALNQPPGHSSNVTPAGATGLRVPLRLGQLIAHDGHAVMYRVTARPNALLETSPSTSPIANLRSGTCQGPEGEGEARANNARGGEPKVVGVRELGNGERAGGVAPGKDTADGGHSTMRYVLRVLLSGADLGLRVSVLICLQVRHLVTVVLAHRLE
jgi:hypothetical protein